MAGRHAQMAAARALADLVNERISGSYDGTFNNDDDNNSAELTAPQPSTTTAGTTDQVSRASSLSSTSPPPTPTLPLPPPPSPPPLSPPPSPSTSHIANTPSAEVTLQKQRRIQAVFHNPQDAATQALAANNTIQKALREELDCVNKLLSENREALKMALGRLCWRAPTITTTSDKFAWARAADKFIETGAHPAVAPSRKEQETLLRTDPSVWLPLQVKVLGVEAI